MTHYTLGSYMRQLRVSRHFSQVQTARMAGIGRVTLNRWESDVQRPREIELESFLTALAASQSERRQILTLLDPLPGRTKALESVVGASERKRIGPRPHIGNLLRALRMRMGLTQEETAKRVGVTERTVRRWEQSDVWPSDLQLHTLCYELKARPEELLALTKGHFLPMSKVASLSMEEIKERSHKLYFYSNDGEAQPLKELTFFSLEDLSWQYAVRFQAGEQQLAEIYSFHANYLSSLERFAECNTYANRALDLQQEKSYLQGFQVMAAIASARSAVYRGARPTPQKGLEILHHWQEAARWPEYKAWLLSDMAKYTLLAGDEVNARDLAKRATEEAASCENPMELYLRELDEAQILVWSGLPKQALRLVEQSALHLKIPLKVKLLETEAYLAQQQPGLAHDCLQDALSFIESKAITQLLPQVKRLALLF